MNSTKKRLLAMVAAIGFAATGFAMQPASAACEGNNTTDNRNAPARHGNEVVGIYVNDVPVAVQAGPVYHETTQAWVEVQDDGEETPVATEAGWRGMTDWRDAGLPVPIGKTMGLDSCSDNHIRSVKDQL